MLAVLVVLAATQTRAQSITGAGATFPAPIYTKWADLYHKETGAKVNYAPIGSSGGIKQLEGKTVDFGATDDPVTQEELTKQGWYQFPTVIGGIVLVVNLKDIKPGQLVLDGPTVAGIYSGKITKWNDPAIAKLNKTLTLPNQSISAVVRSDGSGTTAVFTNYLSMVDKEFKEKVGEGKMVKWGTANSFAGKGNAGVAAMAKTIPGSIGYVEYAYAKQNAMTHAAMLNGGKVVQPSDETFKQAAGAGNWNTPGMAVNLNGKAGWPITSATFILVDTKTGRKNSEIAAFFKWALAKGDSTAATLDFVPLPPAVKSKIIAELGKLGG